MGATEPVEYFLYLASHSHELRLATGARLLDLTDFKAFLIELAEAVAQPVPKREAAVPAQPRYSKSSVDLTCPRCGHVHQGIGECGMPMGTGRICRCELEVSA